MNACCRLNCPHPLQNLSFEALTPLGICVELGPLKKKLRLKKSARWGSILIGMVCLTGDGATRRRCAHHEKACTVGHTVRRSAHEVTP